jgi:hypothetical protein
MNELFGSLDVNTIINLVLGAIVLVGGTLFLKGKTKLKELIAALTAISNAVEDNKVTNEEEKEIVAKFKALIGKK